MKYDKLHGFVPFWVSRDGEAQPIYDLATPHLINILKTYVLMAQVQRQQNLGLADFDFTELLCEQADFQLLWRELCSRGQSAIDEILLYDQNSRGTKVIDPRAVNIADSLGLPFKES